MSTTRTYWTRLAALALGLTLLFGGIGLLPAIYLQSDKEFAATWPFGLLPILMGTGLLLFVRLSRDLTEKIDDQREPR
jgi:hypothetical protein